MLLGGCETSEDAALQSGMAVPPAAVPPAAVSHAAVPRAAVAVQPAVPTATVEFMVEGTNCASCSVEIRRELRRLPGIVDIREGDSKRHLLVEFQASEVQPLQILHAVQSAGYEAEMLVRG